MVKSLSYHKLISGELSIWAKMIKLCTFLCLIPASFNKQTNRFVFRFLSWKFLIHLVFWQIIPLGIDYTISMLLSEEESGDDDPKQEMLTIKKIVNIVSYEIKFHSKSIISFSVSFSVAYLLSTAKISILKIKRPQRWLLFTIYTIFAFIPSGIEIYNLIQLSTIGDVKLINVFILASDVFLLLKRLIAWLIGELYFSSFRTMAEQCKETRSENLAQNYNNLINMYVSLKAGFGPGLLVTFTVNLGNLVSCVYLLTQFDSEQGNASLENVIAIIIIINHCYYFCTSCQMCYNKLTEGSQVLRLHISFSILCISLINLYTI